MEGEGARVSQVERTASVGALWGDTITPALETLEKNCSLSGAGNGGGDVCVEMGKKEGEQRGMWPEEGNRSQITSSTEVDKDSRGGDTWVLIIGGVSIRKY